MCVLSRLIDILNIGLLFLNETEYFYDMPIITPVLMIPPLLFVHKQESYKEYQRNSNLFDRLSTYNNCVMGD